MISFFSFSHYYIDTMTYFWPNNGVKSWYTKYKLKTLKVRNASGAPHATTIAQPGLPHCVLETYFSFPLDKSSNTKPGLQPSFDRLMQQHRWAFCRHDRCQSTVSQICWQPAFFASCLPLWSNEQLDTVAPRHCPASRETTIRYTYFYPEKRTKCRVCFLLICGHIIVKSSSCEVKFS